MLSGNSRDINFIPSFKNPRNQLSCSRQGLIQNQVVDEGILINSTPTNFVNLPGKHPDGRGNFLKLVPLVIRPPIFESSKFSL